MTILEAKRQKRVASLRRHRKKAQEQRQKWKDTKKRGYLRAAKKNSRQAKRDAKAIRKLNALIKAANRPSPNFSYREFYCNDGTPFPPNAKPHIDALCKEVLEPLRKKYGPIRINSAYRHSAYNAAIGGATNSYHIYDLRGGKAPAADITCATGTPDQWAATAEQYGADGIGIYRGSNFVHIDQRGYASKWYG